MVKVAVGQQHEAAVQLRFLQIVQDRRGVGAGVDDGAFQRFFVGGDVAVGLIGADGDGLDEHVRSPFR